MLQITAFWNYLELYGLPHPSKTLPEFFSWDDFFKLVSKWLQHVKTQVGKTCFFLESGSEEKKTSFLRDVFGGEIAQKNNLPYIHIMILAIYNIRNIHIFEQSCFPLVFYSSNCQNQWNKIAAEKPLEVELQISSEFGQMNIPQPKIRLPIIDFQDDFFKS